MDTLQTRDRPYPHQIQSGLYQSNDLPTTKNGNQELLRVKAVRVLDFFPDELVIQEKTVSVIRRELLLSYVETLPVKDIGEVILSEAGSFAALKIISKVPRSNLEIKNLPSNEVKQAKEVLDKLLLNL